MVTFRGALIEQLAEMGHEVIALAPPDDAQEDVLARLGVRLIPIRLARGGMDPYADWRLERQICQILGRERVSVTLAYTIKPIVYGLPAADSAQVPGRYALVTGLGSAFHTRGIKGYVLRRVASILYTRAFRCASGVMVQNADIALFLRRRRMVQPQVPITIVPGSGVDLRRFAVSPILDRHANFVVLARWLRDKGIDEFVQAARIVKRRIPHAVFRVFGMADQNPSAIPDHLVQRWNAEGVVKFCPAVDDVRPLLAESTACVLPSYHEGMPRALLEAMAVGRPIVTTDVIGCREVVPDAGPPDGHRIRCGSNGYLVPVRTVEPLATAMLRIGNDRELATAMGTAGRRLAETKFDVKKVNEAMLHAMHLLPTNRC